MARSIIQVNDRGSWRNVAHVEAGRELGVLIPLKNLIRALGSKPKWRVKIEGTEHVVLDDEQLRGDADA